MAQSTKTRIQFGKFSWGEELVGVALLCVVGWFVLHAIQTQADASTPQNAGNNGFVPQPDTTLAYGQDYFWPGLYGGDPSTSLTTGTAQATSAPGLPTITIPSLSPITLPPVSAPFAPASDQATASGTNAPQGAGCGCSSAAQQYTAPAVNYVSPAASTGAVAANAAPAAFTSKPYGLLLSGPPGLGQQAGITGAAGLNAATGYMTNLSGVS